MAIRLALLFASLVLLFLVSTIACGQGSLDISIPSSFPMAMTGAYGSNNTVDVWGPVEVFKNGDGVYVIIPTNALAGEKLSFFQDVNVSGILFRNNTLALPVQNKAATLLLATGDLVSDGRRFNGQVTGMELDTKALSSGDASVAAALYLDGLPDRASYQVSLTEDEEIEKAIMGEASKAGEPGRVKLMLEVSDTNPEAQSSIGYSIIRIKAGDESEGNVTAYRYYNGAVDRLQCKVLTSAEGPVYETIYAGPGTFAFVWPYQEPLTERASLGSVLTFSGIIMALMLLLVSLTIFIIKRSSKND